MAASAPVDIVSMLARHAAERPSARCLTSGSDALDFATLARRSNAAANLLAAQGIGHGDRVALLSNASPEVFELLFACAKLGAILVPLNWRLSAREIAQIVADCDPALVVVEESHAPLLAEAGKGPRLSFEAYVALRDAAPDGEPDGAGDPDIPALILYTSGTTGLPKGVMLSQRNLSYLGRMADEVWGFTSSSVNLVAMPLFHIGGTAWVMQTLNGGGTGVILAQPDVAVIIATVQRHGITKMFAVPAVLNMILNHPDAAGADFSSMRVLPYGASPIPLDVLSRSMQMFPNAQFVQMYGATETSGTIVYLPPEDHDVAGTPRMKGCGKPFPDVELRIVGEDGQDRAPGEVGEVWVRAPLVMAGYHNLPEANASAFVQGWYRTGDAAYRDEDGYLYLYDRVKDMIVSGGENIYPAEVENALHHHPAVRDCAVIGVPDARWGEAVKAIVVLHPGEGVSADDLIAFARTQIAGFKCPKSVDFVDELPRNPSGKVLKKELRKLYWQEGERQIG